MKLTIGTREIHAVRQGSGDTTLVFLHYWGGSSRTWLPLINLLAPHFDCVAIDQRGWGESDPADSYRITDMADDAEAVIASLGLRRYVLVGHSMGGKVAQLLASRHPHGLAQLVLVAPATPTPQAIPADVRQGISTLYFSREGVEQAIATITALPLLPHLREQVIEDSLRGADDAKRAWPLQAMVEDISAEVNRIAVPTLVLAGEVDSIDRPETLQAELLSRVRGACMEVIPKTGHLSPLEATAELADAIRRFLS